MTYAPKPNAGMLWPNDYKTADNQPDKRGDLFLDRTLLKRLMNSDADLIKLTISGWSKNLNGKDCLSIQAAEPYVKTQSAQPKAAPKVEDDMDDDIPF